MSREKYLIAGGNSTMLVEDESIPNRVEFSQKILGDEVAEQVGFIIKKKGKRYLEMMGGELSVNGMLALAYRLGGRGVLRATGVRGNVAYSNPEGETRISFPLNYQREENMVLLDKIGYLCTDQGNGAIQSKLMGLAERFHKPAFGMAIYDASESIPRLVPVVYVDKLETCIVETACGSGSIAINIVTGAKEIRQQTGKIISVNRTDNRFTVSAEVVKIGDRR